MSAPINVASLYAEVGGDTVPLQKALQEASRQLSAASKEMQGLGNATDKLDDRTRNAAKSSFSLSDGLGVIKSTIIPLTAAVVGFGMAAKKAFEIGEQGAIISQTEKSFDRLGVSIANLRNAAGGTIDDMTLMKSTLTLTAGASGELEAKLLDAAPQLMNIAKAASTLNPALGDTAFMYESIATGVKRASPLILDNLGILVKQGEANELYAAQLGKTVEQLTAEEKQVALLNETMRAGNRLIEQAGDGLKSATDAYARIRSNAKNATDAFKENVHNGLEPLVEWLNHAIFGMQEFRREQEYLESDLGNLTNGYKDYFDQTAANLKTNGLLASALSEVRLGVKDLDADTRKLIRSEVGLFSTNKDLDAYFELIRSGALESGKWLSEYDYIVRRAGNSSMDAGIGMKLFADSIYQATPTLGSFNVELAKQQAILSGSGTGQDMGNIQVFLKVQEEMERAARIAEETARGYDILKASMDGALGQENENYEKTLGGLAEEAGILNSRIAELEGRSWLTPAQKEELDGLKKALDENGQAALDAAADHEEATRRILFGFLEQRLAASSVFADSPEALMLLNDMALAWDLIDQETHDAISTIDGYISSAEGGFIELEEAGDRVIRMEERMGQTAEEEIGKMTGATDTNISRMELLGEKIGAVNEGLENMPKKITIDIEAIIHSRQIIAAGYAVEAFNYGAGGGWQDLVDPGNTETTQSTWNGSININGATDPSATANAVIQKLSDRGIINTGVLR